MDFDDRLRRQPPAEGGLVAALGTVWAHSANTRLVLERGSAARYIRIAKSPSSANVAFAYQVTAAGLEQDVGVAVPQAPGGSVVGANILNDAFRDTSGYFGDG